MVMQRQEGRPGVKAAHMTTSSLGRGSDMTCLTAKLRKNWIEQCIVNMCHEKILEKLES